MKSVRLLPSLAALLLASACGGGSNELADAQPSANDMAFENMVANAQLAEDVLGDEEPVEAVAVAPPPAPAPDLSAEEAAPLAQATEVASAIEQDAAVERVRYQDGWAWRRNGQIIRTASRDGRRVSYFRPGESVPFFVQENDRGFAYSGGRPQRVYDRRGRPSRIDAARRAEAERAAAEARRAREEARRAPSRRERDADARRDDRQARDRDARDDRRDDRRDRAGDRDERAMNPNRNDQRTRDRPDRQRTERTGRDDDSRDGSRERRDRDRDRARDGNEQAPRR